MCDFLLVLYCDYLTSLSSITFIGQKSVFLASFTHPSLIGIPCTYSTKVGIKKLESIDHRYTKLVAGLV